MQRDPEAQSEADTEAQAATEPDDPQTAREELELDLMEADVSKEGEHIGKAGERIRDATA